MQEINHFLCLNKCLLWDVIPGLSVSYLSGDLCLADHRPQVPHHPVWIKSLASHHKLALFSVFLSLLFFFVSVNCTIIFLVIPARKPDCFFRFSGSFCFYIQPHQALLSVPLTDPWRIYNFLLPHLPSLIENKQFLFLISRSLESGIRIRGLFLYILEQSTVM